MKMININERAVALRVINIPLICIVFVLSNFDFFSFFSRNMDTLTPAGMMVFKNALGVFLYDHDHSTDSDARAEEVAAHFERVWDAGDKEVIAKVDT